MVTREIKNAIFLAQWIGASAPFPGVVMLYERLAAAYPEGEFNKMDHVVLMSHLKTVELAYSQGARPSQP